MILYALTSTRAPGLIDVFLDHEDAETALADILRDEPEFADVVHIEPIEVGDPIPVEVATAQSDERVLLRSRSLTV